MYKDYSNNFETATETCQQIRENGLVTVVLDVRRPTQRVSLVHMCIELYSLHPPTAQHRRSSPNVRI
jgi:hypothetical protein